MKLSILIPCYNWNIHQLIIDLIKQCKQEYHANCYEIICIEDGSINLFKNNKIAQLKNVQYEILPNNIGRASIRNLLSKKARFEWLLFIDCDSQIATVDFIKKYKLLSNNLKKENIYYGKTIYKDIKDHSTILHAKYGTLIESKSKKKNFSSHHFLINKKVITYAAFDEKIKSYGYEDILFQITNKFQFIYVDNPLYHIGLKKTDNFLKDCESGLKNLCKYTENNMIIQKIKVLKWWKKLSLIHYLILKIFLYFKDAIIVNLKSKQPNLLLFQFYKLGLLVKLSRDFIKN